MPVEGEQYQLTSHPVLGIISRSLRIFACCLIVITLRFRRVGLVRRTLHPWDLAADLAYDRTGQARLSQSQHVEAVLPPLRLELNNFTATILLLRPYLSPERYGVTGTAI